LATGFCLDKISTWTELPRNSVHKNCQRGVIFTFDDRVDGVSKEV
jgi:hypothetical protein